MLLDRTLDFIDVYYFQARYYKMKVGPGLLGGSAVVFERNVILEIERHHEYYGCHPGQERAVKVTETRQQLLLH